MTLLILLPAGSELKNHTMSNAVTQKFILIIFSKVKSKYYVNQIKL